MDEATPRCEECGYLRVGIDAAARCPECGTTPRVMKATSPSSVIGIAGSAGEQRWLASVAGGLVLLCVCYAIALHSELFMSRSGEALPTINATGPKLAAGAMILRQIGDPGVNGVRGMLAALGGVGAILLITTPQHRGDHAILRRSVRIASVVLSGALFAYLVGRGLPAQRYYYDIRYQYTAAIGVELLVNVPLYILLSRLSRRVDPSGASASWLFRASWLLAIATASGVGLRILERLAAKDFGSMWLGLQCGYGVICLVAGAVMSFACIGLTWRYVNAALARPMRWWRLARGVGIVRFLSAKIARAPRETAALLGIVILCSLARPMVADMLLRDTRDASSWRLQIVSFLGPRLATIDHGLYASIPGWMHPMFLFLAAIALLTLCRPGVWRWVSASVVRWSAIVSVGCVVGASLAIDPTESAQALRFWRVLAFGGVESLVTLMTYLYLARLAAGQGLRRVAWSLAAIGIAGMTMILWPQLGSFIEPSRAWAERSTLVVFVHMAYGGLSFVVSALAWTMIARLAWSLGASIFKPAQLTRA